MPSLYTTVRSVMTIINTRTVMIIARPESDDGWARRRHLWRYGCRSVAVVDIGQGHLEAQDGQGGFHRAQRVQGRDGDRHVLDLSELRTAERRRHPCGESQTGRRR